MRGAARREAMRRHRGQSRSDRAGAGAAVDPLAEWDQGDASRGHGGGMPSSGAAGSSGKALPSPGEILRMNASGAAVPQPPPPKQPPLDARAERDKEIKALIQEENARIKSDKAQFKQRQEAKEWGDDTGGGKGGAKKRKRKK